MSLVSSFSSSSSSSFAGLSIGVSRRRRCLFEFVRQSVRMNEQNDAIVQLRVEDGGVLFLKRHTILLLFNVLQVLKYIVVRMSSLMPLHPLGVQSYALSMLLLWK